MILTTHIHHFPVSITVYLISYAQNFALVKFYHQFLWINAIWKCYLYIINYRFVCNIDFDITLLMIINAYHYCHMHKLFLSVGVIFPVMQLEKRIHIHNIYFEKYCLYLTAKWRFPLNIFWNGLNLSWIRTQRWGFGSIGIIKIRPSHHYLIFILVPMT